MRLASDRDAALDHGPIAALVSDEAPELARDPRGPAPGGAALQQAAPGAAPAEPSGFRVRYPDGVRPAGHPPDRTGAGLRRSVGRAAPAGQAALAPRPYQKTAPAPRPYHEAALDAWELAGCRGVVVRPGVGDGVAVALGAIARTHLPALCLVPTGARLDHWIGEVRRTHAGPLGCVDEDLGVLAPMTIATFAAAGRHAAALEGRYGLLVVEDAHLGGSALPADTLERVGGGARLGLTTAPPRPPVRAALEAHFGSTVCRVEIDRGAGGSIGSFDVVTLELGLDPDEVLGWARERARWRGTKVAFSPRVPPPAWTRAAQVALGRLLARHRPGAVLVVAATEAVAAAIRARLAVEAAPRVVSRRALEDGGPWSGAEAVVLAGLTRGAPARARRAGALLRPAPGRRGVVYALVGRPTTVWSWEKAA